MFLNRITNIRITNSLYAENLLYMKYQRVIYLLEGLGKNGINR
ncbi:hypothetical protein SDC9_113415 [bioreactor metagenome]|uniref:Uncharacterized protein n=1 Tax=bioreactor metagenome TaxID=1076179 RepID=A0A645BMP4_9ZZZZ